MGVYLVHHPLHNFSPEVGGGRLHGNGHLQGTLQYLKIEKATLCLQLWNTIVVNRRGKSALVYLKIEKVR